MAGARRRRSPSALRDNIRESRHPAPRTFWLALRNRAVAVGMLKGCCGHPGEPGC